MTRTTEFALAATLLLGAAALALPVLAHDENGGMMGGNGMMGGGGMMGQGMGPSCAQHCAGMMGGGMMGGMMGNGGMMGGMNGMRGSPKPNEQWRHPSDEGL